MTITTNKSAKWQCGRHTPIFNNLFKIFFKSKNWQKMHKITNNYILNRGSTLI